MGTVRRLVPAGDILGRAADAYLATLRGAEQANTWRAYGQVLRRVAAEFGTGTAPDEISAERFAGWFGQQWGQRAPSTWNVSLDAIRSAVAYWQRQGWITADRRGYCSAASRARTAAAARMPPFWRPGETVGGQAATPFRRAELVRMPWPPTTWAGRLGPASTC